MPKFLIQNIHPVYLKDETSRILYIASKIHAWEGKFFNPGFQKPFRDMVSDTVFETAQRLWRHDHSSASLDLMLHALSRYGLEGELLPELLSTTLEGAITEGQRLKVADIAMKYYDIETADMVIRHGA